MAQHCVNVGRPTAQKVRGLKKILGLRQSWVDMVGAAGRQFFVGQAAGVWSRPRSLRLARPWLTAKSQLIQAEAEARQPVKKRMRRRQNTRPNLGRTRIDQCVRGDAALHNHEGETDTRMLS